MHTTPRGRMPLALLGLLAGIFTGCAPQVDYKAKFDQAYQQLDAPAPDYAAIGSAADAYIAEQPAGALAADAWYLRGRALEAKAGSDRASPQQDWVQAHQAYSRALAQQPRPALEALIRIGLGNVLYFQHRYNAAMSEFQAGIEKSANAQDKAWALYRIGLCQQRLLQWNQADRTFAAVQQQYAGSEPAKRAREHQGAREFWVQVGVFATPVAADGVIADLKKQGVAGALRFSEAGNKGLQYVRVGPFSTYEAAAAIKDRIWSRYNSATILP